jgi:small-conductance mechanosensitive channel
MDILKETFGNIGNELYRFLPLFFVVALSIIFLVIFRSMMKRWWGNDGKHRVLKVSVTSFILTIISISIVITIPVSHETRGEIVTLLGIVISAILTLSSTTFVGNALAGLFLQTTTHFKPGNFIRVDDKFGRVTEMGVFHTEIQTEESNLMTLPNLYLVTHPVTVIRKSSTIISTTLSLGYDVPHQLIEETLKDAVLSAGLTNPFVRIVELGDYSITYQCAGLLEGVKNLLAAHSTLNVKVIDFLHDRGIEIVSPSFMNQRKLSEDKVFIPSPDLKYRPGWGSDYFGPKDEVLFDKAEKAAIYEDIKEKLEEIEGEIVGLSEKLNSVESDEEKSRIEELLKSSRAFKEFLQSQKEKMENENR